MTHLAIANLAFEPYIPTEADRESDRKLEAWRARQLEADRRVLLARLEADRRAAAVRCAQAYEARIRSAA